MKTGISFLSLVAFFLIAFGSSSWAQTKALGQPVIFGFPLDYYHDDIKMEIFLEGTGNKSSTDPWLAFSDRADNPVYDRINGTKTGTIGFREYFYVTFEKDGWVEIIEARMNGLKVEQLIRKVGWVPKKNLLLWNRGLVDPATRINRKVLLLNRADDIDQIIRSQRDVVEVFSGPQTGQKASELRIFGFHYVLKKEGNMLLVGSESELSPMLNDRIIGWVSSRRSASWDNRICLEPNFDPRAFAERKDKPNLRTRAFKDLASAREFTESGGQKAANVIWDDDPVKLKPDRLSKTNPYRFKGEIVRFPMTKLLDAGQGLQILQTGLIGTVKTRKAGSSSNVDVISEIDYAKITERIKQIGQKNNNVNVFFVAEGTACTYAFQQQLVQSIKAIKTEVVTGIPNVRYGALLYRGLAEKELGRLTEYSALSPDINKVIQFLSSAEFQNKQSQDNWTSLYYGISQALQLAKFNGDETNIIVLIGCFGDFKGNDGLKEYAKQNVREALFEDPSPIVESLDKMNAHLYAVQLRNENSNETRGFAAVSRHLMLEAAKAAYNRGYGSTRPETQALKIEFQQKTGWSIPEPRMEEIARYNDIEIEGAVHPGRLLKPKIGDVLTESELSETLKQFVRNSVSHNREVYGKLSALFNDGASIFEVMKSEEVEGEAAIGPLLSPIIQFLDDLLKHSGIPRQDIIKSLDEKYKLFSEAYIPYKIPGASFPAVSYCVFMTQDDLIQYRDLIKLCLVNATSYPDKRKQLFEIHTMLIEQFAGDQTSKKSEEYTREDIFRLMQGLEKSGLSIECPQWNKNKIGDFRNEKIVSNAEIDSIIERYKEIHNLSASIIRLGPNHDFCYVSEAGLNYFWIPVCDIF